MSIILLELDSYLVMKFFNEYKLRVEIGKTLKKNIDFIKPKTICELNYNLLMETKSDLP